MGRLPHFLIARFFTRVSTKRVDCKICGYGLSKSLQSCARHIFVKCSHATAKDKQEVIDVLTQSDDLEVLEQHAVAAFQATQVEQLQRQQEWREQHRRHNAGHPQSPDLQDLAVSLQQAFREAQNESGSQGPSKRARTAGTQQVCMHVGAARQANSSLLLHYTVHQW
jgi:hypothetical protein